MSSIQMSSNTLKCVRCQDYLLDGPIQCRCGDRLCTPCFQLLSVNKQNFKCLECNERVYVKDCFKDKAFYAQLKEMILNCSGCSWQGPGGEYLDHKDNCDYALVECLYLDFGCHERIPRSDIQSHVLNCSFAPKICKWCGNHVLDENMHLRIECMLVPQDCPNKCGVRLNRKEMESHMKDTCTHRSMKCEYSDEGCTFIGNANELEEHYNKKFLSHLKLTNSSLKQLGKSMESRLLALSKDVSDLKSEVYHLHRETSVQFEPVISNLWEVKDSTKRLQNECADLASSLQVHQASTFEGKIIWKIPEIERRRHEAKTGKTSCIYSVPFFTHKQGYKACLRLYLNGCGSYKDTDLSLFFTIMKGEYDAILKWPFRVHEISLTLLNQDGGKNITESLKPNPSCNTFKRPMSELNIPYGCSAFAPLSVLCNSSYVKDDTMFFKCEMNAINMKHP